MDKIYFEEQANPEYLYHGLVVVFFFLVAIQNQRTSSVLFFLDKVGRGRDDEREVRMFLVKKRNWTMLVLVFQLGADVSCPRRAASFVGL